MIGALFGSLFVKYVIGNNANLGANVSKIEQGINERSVNLVVDQSIIFCAVEIFHQTVG